MTKILLITGDTFTSREQLKALGRRWVPHLRAWFVPGHQRHAVERLRDLIGFSVTLVSLPRSGGRFPFRPAQKPAKSSQ